MKRNRAKETYDQLRNPQKRIKLSLRTRLTLACILFISTIFGKIYIFGGGPGGEHRQSRGFASGNAALPGHALKIIDHGLQCDFLHRFPDGILNLVVRGFQDSADILCHRTWTSLAGMDPNQGSSAVRFQCGIDLVQGDLGGVSAQLCTAGSSWNGDEPRFFQSAENIADHNRIAARTFRQQIAGYFCDSPCFMDKYQTVHRNGAFHTDLHIRIRHPFQPNQS